MQRQVLGSPQPVETLKGSASEAAYRLWPWSDRLFSSCLAWLFQSLLLNRGGMD